MAHRALPSTTSNDAGPRAPLPDSRRWIALAAVAVAQLMIGLDQTIMTIALPSVQGSLHFGDADRQWVITAFAVTYGSLLLTGGRLGDRFGRQRALLAGVTGFALASALGGAAPTSGVLFAARAAQGAFGALMTPAVLAVIVHAFTDLRERGRAFAIYGTVMGSSSGIGVLLGGVLTQYLDWRWCMLVNLPIAAAAALGISYGVRAAPGDRSQRLDLAGALLVTLALAGIALGFAQADSDGWGAVSTLAPLAAGAVLLVAFVARQATAKPPLLPLRIVLNRRRAASYLAVAGLAVGWFGSLFFLTFYLQSARDFSAIKAGLAFLPLTAGLMIGVRLVARVLHRHATAGLLLPAGLLVIAAGLALLTALHTSSNYWALVMPVFALVGLGSGWVLITANSIATHDAGADTSVAGAMVVTSQQAGAALGTALLNTIAASAAAHYARTHHVSAIELTVHGLNTAALVAAVAVAVVAVAAFTMLGRPGSRPTGQEPANSDTGIAPGASSQ